MAVCGERIRHTDGGQVVDLAIIKTIIQGKKAFARRIFFYCGEHGLRHKGSLDADTRSPFLRGQAARAQACEDLRFAPRIFALLRFFGPQITMFWGLRFKGPIIFGVFVQ